MISNIFNGFCMALADSVPGVSGGTIAFILGFYEKLINSIHDIFSKDKKSKKAAISFLTKLMVGWVIGMGISATLLSKIFESKIYFLSSVFMGLTIASIPFIINEEIDSIRESYKNIVFSVFGVILVVGISMMRNTMLNSSSINLSSLTVFQYIYVFFAGMIAISAMVLPGISGSTILLILGLYVPVINAVKDFFSFNLSGFFGLMAFGLGIITGLLVSIKSIRSALKNHKSRMIYFVLGLMAGSLYAIAMGPTTLKIPQKALGISTFEFSGFILGIIILFVLEFIGNYSKSRPVVAD